MVIRSKGGKYKVDRWQKKQLKYELHKSLNKQRILQTKVLFLAKRSFIALLTISHFCFLHLCTLGVSNLNLKKKGGDSKQSLLSKGREGPTREKREPAVYTFDHYNLNVLLSTGCPHF